MTEYILYNIKYSFIRGANIWTLDHFNIKMRYNYQIMLSLRLYLRTYRYNSLVAYNIKSKRSILFWQNPETSFLHVHSQRSCSCNPQTQPLCSEAPHLSPPPEAMAQSSALVLGLWILVLTLVIGYLSYAPCVPHFCTFHYSVSNRANKY